MNKRAEKKRVAERKVMVEAIDSVREQLKAHAAPGKHTVITLDVVWGEDGTALIQSGAFDGAKLQGQLQALIPPVESPQ